MQEVWDSGVAESVCKKPKFKRKFNFVPKVTYVLLCDYQGEVL